MLKRALLAAAVATAVVLSGTPAQAIPPGPTLFVVAYFSDLAKTNLIGQRWAGCNQPSGSWGVTTGINTVYFTPC